MRLKKIINLYGGPGCGKSTAASGLFFQMKSWDYSVELMSEFAKELTYDERFNILNTDQLYIFAKQHRQIMMMKDKVDYIISDGPLLLPYVYFRMNRPQIYDEEHFSNLVITTNNKYPNLNIFLTRNPKFKYEEVGRSQTLDEAKLVDFVIKQVLLSCTTDFEEIKSDNQTVNKILKMIEEK